MSATHPSESVAVGDIFCMSWGYDQTNVDYFQVVELTAKGIKVREIGTKAVPGTAGFMCQDVSPDKDNFLAQSSWCKNANEPTFRKVGFYNGTPGISFGKRYYARRVAPDSKTYSSWYA